MTVSSKQSASSQKRESKKMKTNTENTQSAVERERKSNKERLSAKSFNRLDSFKTELASDKLKTDEQRLFVIATALCREVLSNVEFTKERFADAVNESSDCDKLNIKAYLYKHRDTDEVQALKNSDCKLICADRVLQRETVHLTHKDKERAKTSNTYHTLHKSSIADASTSANNVKRHRESIVQINTEVQERLQAIAELALSIASK